MKKNTLKSTLVKTKANHSCTIYHFHQELYPLFIWENYIHFLDQ